MKKQMELRKIGQRHDFPEYSEYRIYVNGKAETDKAIEIPGKRILSNNFNSNKWEKKIDHVNCSGYPRMLAMYYSKKHALKIGYIQGIGIERQGKELEFRSFFKIGYKMMRKVKTNPFLLLDLIKKHGGKNGLKVTRWSKLDFIDNGPLHFSWHTKPEGTIGEKKEKYKQLINDAIEKALVEIDNHRDSPKNPYLEKKSV